MSRVPAHPLLVGLLPILSMYGATPGTSRLEEVLIACGLALAASALLMGLATLAYRDARKAAMFVSVLLILFVSFDTVYALVEDWTVAGWRPGRRRYVLPLTYVGLAAFAVWLYRLRASLGMATAMANVLALGALLPPVIALTTTFVEAGREAGAVPPPADIRVAGSLTRTPDIYYFVFDRYGDERTLRANGIDNEPFYAWLQDRGFYVARESRSNYLKTVLSLASSLNMSYLDDVAGAQGAENGNWQPIFDRVAYHRVGAFLRNQGYEYIHLGSWFWPTRQNPQATRHLNYYVAAPKPVVRLFDTVLFAPVQRLLKRPLLDQRRQHWYRITRQVEDVVALAPQPGPKFVLLHVLVPHPPYVFGPDGRYVTRDEESRRSRQENYANQVRAANGMIRRLVERILAASPEPPVIILQGDEGPYPPGTDAAGYEWRQASRATLDEKTGILNAYYLPGMDARALYPHITPVNTFRLVFNTYLGTAMPLLPDRVYRHASDDRPYAFDDITDVLRPAPPRAAVRTTLP